MPTKLIRSLQQVTPKEQGMAVTIGNFDGVHRGHQEILKKLRQQAALLNLPSMVITFEPHPAEYFAGEKLRIPRLTRLREKFTALAKYAVDYVLILPFNQNLANTSASDFIKKILVESLKVKYILTGEDFHFGYKREGDTSFLQQQSKIYGFTSEIMPEFLIDGERVSSTRIRQALAEDNQALVKQLLGHAYSMQGRVRHGDKLGRQLGFPTLNIHLHRKLTPVKGVYTVSVHGLANKPLPGAANIGIRPTVDGTQTLLEVHLLDFNQDVYGCYVTIEFCKKLHEERRYPNLEILKQNIAIDVEQARAYFQEQGVL